MKTRLLILLNLIILSGCTVNRYYYIAEEPIDLFEFSSFSGKPILTAAIGDTVAATGTDGIRLGGKTPVEYRGYSFYAPYAKARFLRVARVHKRRDAAASGIAYTTRRQYGNGSDATTPGYYGYTPATGAAIHTGPRGGRYYINSQGNKTYVPRNGSTRTSSGSTRSRSNSRSSSTTRSSSGRSSSGSSYRSSGGGRGRH